MGVPWGIVSYRAGFDADRLIAEWRPLALAPAPREFNVMRGEDRLCFRRLAERDAGGSWSVQVEQAKDAAARARVDALKTGAYSRRARRGTNTWPASRARCWRRAGWPSPSAC